MKKHLFLSLLAVLALASCTNEEVINQEFPNKYEKRISVVAEDLTPAEGTRTSYTDNGNGYSFAWSEGDALGIFPTSGHQTDFPISEGKGAGTNTAIFDGGDWALKPNASYAAYYPVDRDLYLDKTAIPVNYTGQVQNGNGSTAHLGKYDYMASTFAEVDAKGNVNFRLQHLGCLVQFKLTMPDADTYTALEITSDKTPFITSAKYSLSDNVHAFYDVQTSQTITVGLSNVSTTAEDKTLTITAMFAPVDLSGSKLTLSVHGNKNYYAIEIDGKYLSQGRSTNNSPTEALTVVTPFVTFHADDVQTLTMSQAVTSLEYSVNNGEWSELGTNTVTFGGDNGDLRLRGSNGYGTASGFSSYSTIVFGDADVYVECRGDIRTLVDYANYRSEDTTNDKFCYLFNCCTSLTSAPELPATALADRCYGCMFSGCTSLTTAPALPATFLADFCYVAMFMDCTSLSTGPRLPATTLAQGCYRFMFWDCTSLNSAPELPASSLAEGCYLQMFDGCTSLTSAPELPATTLAPSCYEGMFHECTNLGYIKMMATDISADDCLKGWTYCVAPTGTFVKNVAADWYERGQNGIPNGWTVKLTEFDADIDRDPEEESGLDANGNIIFEDLAFKNRMVYGGYDTDGDGEISFEEAKAVTCLILCGDRSWDYGYLMPFYHSLKGIEYFPNLTELYCYYNDLTELDLSKNTKLTTLKCYCNQLTTLDLSRNTALTTLECGQNPLTELDVTNNTQLTYLSCNGEWDYNKGYMGKITSLQGIEYCKNLASLYCSGNQLTVLDVSKNSVLTELVCSGNQLTVLDVSKNSMLTWLNCHDNPNLTTIYISEGQTFDDLLKDETATFEVKQ